MAAPILTLDIAEGARVETSPTDLRITRVCLAENIPTTNPRALLSTALGMDGLPRYNEIHPEFPQASVRRFVVTPTGEPNSAWIDVIYETPGPMSGEYGLWYVRDETTVHQEMWGVDWNGESIVAEFTPPAAAVTPGFSPVAGGAKKIPFALEVPRLVPMRTITVAGYLRTPPSGRMLYTLGSVNQKTWFGLPKGFWLCTGLRADAHLTSKKLKNDAGIQAKGIGISMTFISRVYRDWREYGFYRDFQNKLTEIDRSVVGDLVKIGYRQDQIRKEKVTVVGLYPMADFRDIFGFGENEDAPPSTGNSWGSPSTATNLF